MDYPPRSTTDDLMRPAPRDWRGGVDRLHTSLLRTGRACFGKIVGTPALRRCSIALGSPDHFGVPEVKSDRFRPESKSNRRLNLFSFKTLRSRRIHHSLLTYSSSFVFTICLSLHDTGTPRVDTLYLLLFRLNVRGDFDAVCPTQSAWFHPD